MQSQDGAHGEDAGLRLTYLLLMQCVTNLGSACRKGQWDSRFSYATVAKRGSEYAKHSDRVMDYRFRSVWHLLDQDELGCGALGVPTWTPISFCLAPPRFEMSWAAGLLVYRLGLPTCLCLAPPGIRMNWTARLWTTGEGYLDFALGNRSPLGRSSGEQGSIRRIC